MCEGIVDTVLFSRIYSSNKRIIINKSLQFALFNLDLWKTMKSIFSAR